MRRTRKLVSGVLRRWKQYGFDPRLVLQSWRGRRTYRANRAEYFARADHEFPRGTDWPCLRDRFDAGGVARGQYFHQDLLVAQWIYGANPRRHVDVGSRVDGFVAHVATFREIDVLDIRQISSCAAGIRFFQRDITATDSRWHGVTDSLSCLHSIEHFGLGRYGDTVDPEGWRRGWDNLVEMVEPGGTIYLSTMIGPQRVEFDAHRVFSVSTLIDLVHPQCEIVELAFVDDDGDLHRGADWTADEAATSFGCQTGCGILRLRRRLAQ